MFELRILYFYETAKIYNICVKLTCVNPPNNFLCLKCLTFYQSLRAINLLKIDFIRYYFFTIFLFYFAILRQSI